MLRVVICFHFTIFVVLETTNRSTKNQNGCCDLLSFYYLCRTGNNPLSKCNALSLLWFAFILLSLSYWKQQPILHVVITFSCDLLSFYYLCRTGNNVHGLIWQERQVVICFHFTIFVVLETTKHTYRYKFEVLWFAFILLSLSYWKQPLCFRASFNLSCDLLSFYYLCRTGNNIVVIIFDW